MNTMPVVEDLLQDQDITFSFYSKGGANLLVSAFVVEETIFGLPRIDVMLVSEQSDIDLDALIDEPATLTVHHKYLSELRHFSGVVVEAEAGDTGHHQTLYRLTLLPSLYRLDNGSDCRIFQNQSIPDIIKQVLGEYDIEDVTWKIGDGHEKREFLVCFNETHLAFIERIMAEEGIFYFFNHGKEGSLELVITDQPSETPLCSGQSTLDYNALASGVSKQPYCWSIRHRQRLKATRFAQRDRTFKNPKAPLAHADRTDKKAEKGDYALYRYPGRYKKDAVGESATRMRLEAARVDAGIIEGETNTPLLVSGHKFALASHPDKRLDTTWRVLTMRHEGTQPQAGCCSRRSTAGLILPPIRMRTRQHRRLQPMSVPFLPNRYNHPTARHKHTNR